MKREGSTFDQLARCRPGEILPVWPHELHALLSDPRWQLLSKWRGGMGRGYVGTALGVDVFEMWQ